MRLVRQHFAINLQKHKYMLKCSQIQLRRKIDKFML